MSEEQNQEITSPAAPNNAELDALKNSIQALEKKNYELLKPRTGGLLSLKHESASLS
jgi:hypothetical protein